MTVLVKNSRRHLGMPFAAALAVGAVVLAGCQSDAEPPVGTTAAGSASPSASPSSSSPTPSPSPSVEIPAAAREKTEKGAEAFVRYFFDQFNEAWTKPQPGLIAALSHAECEFCETTEQTSTFLAREKQRYAVEPVTLKTVDAFVGAPEGQMYLAASIQQERANIMDARNAVVATDERKKLERNIVLKWQKDHWVMLEVEKAE